MNAIIALILVIVSPLVNESDGIVKIFMCTMNSREHLHSHRSSDEELKSCVCCGEANPHDHIIDFLSFDESSEEFDSLFVSVDESSEVEISSEDESSPFFSQMKISRCSSSSRYD